MTIETQSESAMCTRCGGRMEPRIVRFCAANANPPVFIDAVPAKVCRRCGGEVFTDETIEVFEYIKAGNAPTLPRQPVMKAYDYRTALAYLRQRAEPPDNVIDLATVRSASSASGAIAAGAIRTAAGEFYAVR